MILVYHYFKSVSIHWAIILPLSLTFLDLIKIVPHMSPYMYGDQLYHKGPSLAHWVWCVEGLFIEGPFDMIGE